MKQNWLCAVAICALTLLWACAAPQVDAVSTVPTQTPPPATDSAVQTPATSTVTPAPTRKKPVKKPVKKTAAKTAVKPKAAKSPAVTVLTIKEMTLGHGATAVTGKTVTVHYTGWLTNGTKFDSSVDRQQPFTFHLGAGEVIPGWDKGVVGMKVGGKRKLTIPPSLGYGAAGVGPIPPNATLIFDIQLLSVQ